MVSASDFIHLPYTHDLTEAGIAYAIRSLPYAYNRTGYSPYDRMRRMAAGVAVELAFRRYLGEHEIPFDVIGAEPFTEPDHYDVSLGGRRCDIQSFLITQRDRIAEMKRNPQILLNAPALVPSDQNVAEGNRGTDIYLFAFLSGLMTASQSDLQKIIQENQPHHFVHVMPAAWARPQKWTPLGELALKSDSEETLVVEIGGQDAGREMQSVELEMPPRMRVQMNNRFFSVTHLQCKTLPNARIGIHSSQRKETHIINPLDWGNIWVYGMDILLAGYLTREEFTRQASFLREGMRVFQYDRTPTKNLAVSVHDLKPLSELFERVKEWTKNKGDE